VAKKVTTVDFIENAYEVHRDRYDYSKVVYVKAREKVIITCKIHGDFPQSPNSHLKGHGCPDCGGKKQWSQQKFVTEANRIHDGKYDYSMAFYRDMYTSVTISCPIHGHFEKKPVKHIHSEQGCQKCSKISRIKKLSRSQSEYLRLVREKHGSKYDYSNVIYTNKENYIEIRCKIHDWTFKQKAGNHLLGQGCRKCANQYSPTTEEWIEMAIQVHGDRYDYSRSEYINQGTKIDVGCPIHGEIQVYSDVHLRGGICNKCTGRDLGTEEWINRFISVHGNKYDYSEFVFENLRVQGKIICPIHGEFLQTPGDHYHQESGCRDCADWGFNPKLPADYYVLSVSNNNDEIVMYKSGITNDLVRRLKEHKRLFDNNFLKVKLVDEYHFDVGQEAEDFENLMLNMNNIRSPNIKGLSKELFVINPLEYALMNGLL